MKKRMLFHSLKCSEIRNTKYTQIKLILRRNKRNLHFRSLHLSFSLCWAPFRGLLVWSWREVGQSLFPHLIDQSPQVQKRSSVCACLCYGGGERVASVVVLSSQRGYRKFPEVSGLCARVDHTGPGHNCYRYVFSESLHALPRACVSSSHFFFRCNFSRTFFLTHLPETLIVSLSTSSNFPTQVCGVLVWAVAVFPPAQSLFRRGRQCSLRPLEISHPAPGNPIVSGFPM